MYEKKNDETSYRMEGISFGLADGVICCLGLTIGVAEATSNPSFVVMAGLIGGLANAFGNSIGFYMSQSTERALQIHQIRDHGATTRIHFRKEVLMNSLLSFAASIVAVTILIAPFVFLDITSAYVLTFIFGIALSFLLGSYVGKLW